MEMKTAVKTAMLTALGFVGVASAALPPNTMLRHGWTCDGVPVTVPRTWNAADGTNEIVLAAGSLSARHVLVRRTPAPFPVPEPYRDVFCRCDLHPRWRPDGRQLGFNSVHEGSRQVYVIDVKEADAELLDEDFTRPLSNAWRLPAKWRVADGAGYGWSKALVYENDDKDWYEFASCALPGLRPLMKAEATFRVKADPGFVGKVGATIAWDDADGKYAGGSGGTTVPWGDKSLVPDTQGFVTLTVKTPSIPACAARCHLDLYVARGSVGKVAFDDVKVRLTDVRRVGRMFANGYQGEVARGDAKVTVRLSCEGMDPLPKAVFTYLGADGRRQSVPPTELTPTTARLVVPVTELAPGAQTVGFALTGADGRDLGTASCPLARTAGPTPRKVRFDEYNRTIVDGRPFFPIGMFWSENTYAIPGALDEYAKGPFNCLQNYERRMTRAMLDDYWKRGLRVLASVKDIYAPTEKGARIGDGRIKTMADEEKYVTDVVTDLRDHPALLAWDICDEFGEALTPRLEIMHRRVRRLDPDHPTFICICDPNAAGRMVDGYDVVGVDPYPVANPYCGTDRPEQLLPERGAVTSAGDAAQVVREAMDGCRAMWHVPQAFAWKWDFAKRKELRFPTRKELSNMTWQMVADGANGIFLYSYGQIRNKPERLHGEDWRPYFQTACAVAQELKDRYETLVALPGPAAADVPKTVRVRTWTLAGGTLAVLVVNRGNDPVKGAFRVPGKGEVAFDLAGLEVKWL